MAKCIRHRGPDWSGMYTHPHTILAHERLAIVDPASGKQPLFSADKKLVLAVNGEIYNHHALRAQLEAIRGVACGEVLKSLMERRLVKIVGRAEEVGRPMLYGTTPEFLRVFGIANLSDLPQAKDLR